MLADRLTIVVVTFNAMEALSSFFGRFSEVFAVGRKVRR
jgi:hypothetical protein